MVECGDKVKLKEDETIPVLASIKRKIQGRVGTVLEAWDPVNGHPSFWMQCTVRFDACGRKREITLDLMQDWLYKCDATRTEHSATKF